MSASSLASGSRPTGGVSMITQSKRGGRLLDDPLHPLGGQAAHRIGIGPAGRQQRQPRRDLRQRQLLLLLGAQAVAEARDVRDLEHLVKGRPPEVGVDQQHRAPVRLAEGEREVRAGQRLALAGHRARHHHDLHVLLQLGVVEHAGQLPVLLGERRPDVGGGDDLLGQLRVEALEERDGRSGARSPRPLEPAAPNRADSAGAATAPASLGGAATVGCASTTGAAGALSAPGAAGVSSATAQGSWNTSTGGTAAAPAGGGVPGTLESFLDTAHWSLTSRAFEPVT